MRFLKKELKQLSYPSKEKVVKVTTITLFSSIILAGLISFFADFLFFIMIQRGRNSTFQFEAYYFH